jgi:excinuclease ABC subunit A
MVDVPYLRIRGAREHNLKNIDIDIPKNKMVVLTGLSGSGKSSLAFDTIYADGQRRYLESLSSYARQFIGQMKKPDVTSIEGLSPAISISQKSTSHNPRSTVGTVTEIYDYLRLLYARIGIPHCTECGREISKQSLDQIVDQIMTLSEGTRIMLLAPVVRGRKGSHQNILKQMKRSGYVRAYVDGTLYDLAEEIVLDKNQKHNIEIVVDRLVIRTGIEARLTDSLESAFKLSDGFIFVEVIGGERLMFSQNLACPDCGISIGEIEPRSFSFNSPFGACPECYGLGHKMEFDEDLMIPDKSLSIDEGAIAVRGWRSSEDKGSYTRAVLEALAKEFRFSLSVPFESYPKEIRDLLLFGTDKSVKVHYKGERGEGVYDVVFKGIINSVERRYRETSNPIKKAEYETFMRTIPCKVCKGQRLKKESLAVTVAGKNIYEITDLSIGDMHAFLNEIKFSEFQTKIAKQILREIRSRVGFLIDVGLDYLKLSRAAGTLSGGELQRIRLATQIGSGLVGVDYILDEPSIGLHQRDNEKLLNALRQLRDLGNTVLVVEHDEETMLAADYIIDIGPEAGVHGGEVVVCGSAEDLKKKP